MKTLAYHEGIPGHHFQIATAQGLKGLPLIRQQSIYGAYVEGWALYAERLAAEIGLYKDDPLGDLGRLQAELLRAVRLVVDTGIHAQGWTREQAIDYMVDTTGHGEERRDLGGRALHGPAGPGVLVQGRPAQDPGAARKGARGTRATKFNLKDFHTVVLENGSVPLTVLEQLVDEWIAKVKAQA